MGLLEKFPPAVQEKAYNPSAHVALDPQPSLAPQNISPIHTPPEATQIPLAPNRGPPS